MVRSYIVSKKALTNMDELIEKLKLLGAEIVTNGWAVLTINVDEKHFDEIQNMKGVLRIEVPKKMVGGPVPINDPDPTPPPKVA